MDAVQKQALKCEPTTYKNSDYKDGVFEVLQSLRKNDSFCDIKIQTDDGEIVLGHKLILISASPYFRAMFTSFEETNKDYINIKDLDFKVLQILIDYMYTGEIRVTTENVQVVLPAADLLQLDYVKQACVEFLIKQLDPSNCLSIKAFADIYNCKELLLTSEEFIKRRFLEVVEYDEFLSLSSTEVIKLISCDEISVPLEEKAFECVINWVKYELNCRIDFLPDLMEHVRLPLVSKKYLLDKVVDEPLLKSSPKCKDYVFEALHFNLIKSVNPLAVPLTVRSKPRGSLQKVVLMVGISVSKQLKTIWYDPATNQCQIVPEWSILYKHVSMGVIYDQFVFAVGGGHQSHSCSVKMLDVSSQNLCWVPMNELLVSRKCLGVGVLNNCLYAVGGENSHYLNSVEVYNFCTQQWKMVSSMSSIKSYVGVGVLNNLLYVVGGFNGSGYLNSVECYDPSIDKWKTVAPISGGRRDVSVGVLDGIMYAIGGRNHSRPIKTVEAFEPSTGVWKFIPDMNFARENADVFALDGLLYVVGGRYDKICDNSIEIYNPQTNFWSVKTLSNDLFSVLGAVLVNKPSHL